MIDEIWDAIADGFSYIISFEWFGDFWEFISSAFENLGEFSIIGILFGVCASGLIFILRKWTLNPFLLYMGGVERLVWSIITYLGCFIGGYFLGVAFENT